MIDEPEIRGGRGTGPTPLGYFVTGAASCLMMQYANVLKEKPMPLESIKMLARAHNDRDSRVFTDMIYQVNISTGEQFKPEFLKISPNNRIPAMVDTEPSDGKGPLSVFESGAILQYLGQRKA